MLKQLPASIGLVGGVAPGVGILPAVHNIVLAPVVVASHPGAPGGHRRAASALAQLDRGAMIVETAGSSHPGGGFGLIGFMACTGHNIFNPSY